MTQKERLVELFKQAEIQFDASKPRFDQYADNLLKNGVIVPPCKVGTEFYFPTWSDGIMSDVVKEISFDGSTFVFNGRIAKFNDYDIGKRVFLTTEEAEQALKEREKSD